MARAPKKIVELGSEDPFKTKEPRYLSLAKEIARDIRSGVYGVGELLPPEGELARHAGVGRHTVREALRNLREVGLVSVHHGIGTRVRAPEVKPRHVFSIGKIDDFLRYVRDTTVRIHRRERVSAPLASVDLPDVGEDWIVLEGCRYQKRESRPICWTKVYLNPAYGDVARSTGRTREPLFIQIENRYEERVEEIEQQIAAVALPPELSKILQAQPLTPALSTVRRYLGREGRVFFVTVTIHPADRFRYEQKLQRDSKPRMAGEMP